MGLPGTLGYILVVYAGIHHLVYASIPRFVGSLASPPHDSYLTAGGCTRRCVWCFTLLVRVLKEEGLSEEETRPSLLRK